MKRVFLIGILAFVGAATPALAQTGSKLSARITTATEGAKTRRFEVPQIQLANTAAAKRINRRLAWLLLGEETDSTLSVSRQLRQAERACCYDAENGLGWNTVGQGLTGCNYHVLLNQQGLLSVEYSQEYTGAYSWGRTAHATFDLQTGRQLTLADIVADSPAQLTRRMHGAINRRFRESLDEMRTEGADSTEIAFVAGCFAWDWSAKRVRFKSEFEATKESFADEPDLECFAITPRELRLYYGRVLPHVIQNYEPDETYHFPYARVQLRGLLVPVAKAASAKRR
jgi:hypothetical protein